MMRASAIETLATFIATVPRDRHPATAIDRAKLAFADTMGCILLGARSDDAGVVTATAAPWGTGRAPVFGAGATLPAPWAAMANATAAHAYDLDDYTLVANDHPSAVLVPALLAAASQKEQVSGAALLDAYLIGLEVIFRLGEAVNMGHYKLGWHTTSTLDSLGATAAICRLMGVGADGTAAALSLTTSMGSGYVSQFGTMAKPLHAGLSAKTGIVAAGLGQAGATANLDALDGPVSFATLLVPDGMADFDRALAGLGAPWAIEEFGLGAKLYPSCGYIHRAIDAAVDLHDRLGLGAADEIDSVTVSLPDFYLAVLPYGVPCNRREALFSPAFCVALALLTGGNRVRDVLVDGLERDDVLALSGRISVSERLPRDARLNLDPDDPDIVTVRLKNGRQARSAVGAWRGVPGQALSPAAFETKFHDCCDAVLPDGQQAAAERVFDALMRLDGAPTLTPLMTTLSAMRATGLGTEPATPAARPSPTPSAHTA